MPHTIQFFPGEPIIIFNALDPFDPYREPNGAMRGVESLKAKYAHVYRILNFLQSNMSFSKMLLAMDFEKDKPGGSNDKQVTTVFVGSTKLVEFGVRALQEQPEQYGQTNVHGLFTSVDEALAKVREMIRKEQL